MWVFLIFLPHPKLRNIFMTLQTFQEPSFTCITHDKLIYFLFILLHHCCCCCLVIKSCPTFATPWTIALHAPLPMRFPRQEYWHGLPFLSPEDLPDPGIESMFPHWQAGSLPLSHQRSPGYIQLNCYFIIYQ